MRNSFAKELGSPWFVPALLCLLVLVAFVVWPLASLFHQSAVDPETGRLAAMFWTHDRVAGQDVNAHIAWGSPDGRQWTYPVDAGFAGQIPNPVVLADGRLMAVYVHRHYPPSLRAVVSSDFGKTWDVANELVYYEHGAAQAGMAGTVELSNYYDDMGVWSFGHTHAGLLPDGTVFVAWYAGDADSLSIHWARIEV